MKDTKNNIRNFLFLSNDSLNKPFILSFFILWIFYIFRYPTLSFASEVFAEHGTNYLYYAYNKSFFENLWKADAGYLVWFPRLISMGVSYLSTPYYYIYITNFISLAVSAYTISFINHRGIRCIIKSDIERFLIGLILGLFILPQYENFTYVNFVYHGFLFNLFILFIDKNSFNRIEYFLYSALFALFCISKFHFVTFLPIIIVAGLMHLNLKDKKSAGFYIPAIITILIQIGYVFIISKQESSLRQHTIIHKDFITIFLTSLKGFYWWLQAYSVHIKFLKMPLLANLISLSFIIGGFFYLVKKYKGKILKNKVFLLIITANILAMAYASISCFRYFINDPVTLSIQNFGFYRSLIITYAYVWIGIYAYISNLVKIKRNLLLTAFVLASVIITCNKGRPDFYYNEEIKNNGSDWKKYYPLFNNLQYCIPVNPLGWGFLEKNCGLLKKEENVSVGEIDTSDLHEKGNEIISFLIEFRPSEDLNAFIYNKEAKIIRKLSPLTDKKRHYKYFVFKKNLPVCKIVIKKENGQILDSKGKLFIFGI